MASSYFMIKSIKKLEGSIVKIIDVSNEREYLKEIKDRKKFIMDEVDKAVEYIIKDVMLNKDDAVREYTKKFDNVLIKDFLVSQKEIEDALRNTSDALLKDLEKAKVIIEKYHKKQMMKSYSIYEGEDMIFGQLVRPLERVGIYIPGGRAAYPSTVLMNAVPAKIVGVKEIIMITPPDADERIKDSILAAAYIAGVDKIYKVGGAQGIAALAFGTESIPKVEKITGDGNIYVTSAKRKVNGLVGIDMIAGPGEILIIADEWANPKYIAADLISQAECGEMSSAILVTYWEPLAYKVLNELELQLKYLERGGIVEKSLRNNGFIIIVSCMAEAVDVVNEIAPERLEILTRDPFEVYRGIKNAGAIFLGEYSFHASGFLSPLSVDDFVKKTSLIYYSKQALYERKYSIMGIAQEEGLTGHVNSIKVRFEDEFSINVFNNEVAK